MIESHISSRGRQDLISDMLRMGSQRSPKRTLFSMEGGESRTYGEVDVRANRVANALLAQGVRRGDRIAVWADDSVEYMEIYMAAARAGFAVVPINHRFTGAEAKYVAADSDARCLVFSDQLAGRVEETFAHSDFAMAIGIGSDLPIWARSFNSVVASSSDSTPEAPNEEDLYIIAYTSGTSGFPKGAMLTHRSVKNLARMNTISYRLPLYGVAAYTGSMSFSATVCAFAMSHMYVGGSVHLMGKWDPERALSAVVREHANFIYVPTPGIEAFCEAEAAEPGALDSLTSVLHSASKASPARLKSLAECVGPRLIEGWGMTEISGGLVSATTRSDFEGPCDARDIYASVGRATVDAVIEVVDADRRPILHDGVAQGELAVRSASMMAGYWGRPEATAAVLADGWYYTGDIGAIDEAGYVYVSDRRSDLIVSGGMNVYPSEVEQVIGQMPAVREAAVVGVPHDRFGQTVAAAVVCEPGSSLTEGDVVAYCRERLASYKKPTLVRFVSELPRTLSMKIRHAAVRDQVFGDLRNPS